MTSWPSEFNSVKEALECYNKLGLDHKIIFKVIQPNQAAQGVSVSRFYLVCVYGKLSEKKKPQSGALCLKQTTKNFKCPVSVCFRFKPNTPESEEGKFVRTHNMVMQHTHQLVIDEKRVLLRPEIQLEIKLLMQSGLTFPMLVNFVNKKYNLTVPLGGFNQAVSSVRREIHSCIDFSQTQTL